jgi:hypothetical protein
MSCSAYEIEALLSAAVGTEINKRGLEETILNLGFGDEKYFFFKEKLTNGKIVLNNAPA